MIIVLYDDKLAFRQYFEKLLLETSHNLILSTDNQQEVITYAESSEPSLFYIDILIFDVVKGLKVGKEIKEKNANHQIIFITQFPDLINYETYYKSIAFLTIYKSKNHFNNELIDSLMLAEMLFNSEKKFIFNDKEIGIFSVPINNILYFERIKNSKKVEAHYILVGDDGHGVGTQTFNSSLKKVKTALPCNFIYSHASFITNVHHISSIVSDTIYFDLKGEHCPLSKSHRKKGEIKKWLS